MKSRYRLYFGTLAAMLGSFSFIINRKRYPGFSLRQLGMKTALDLGMLGILAFIPLLTPLLVVWSTMWIAGQVKWKDNVWQSIGLFFTGLSLGWLASRALEVILVAGLFSVDLFTGRFVRNFRELQT